MKSSATQLQYCPCAILSLWLLHMSSIPDLQLVQHMFNCILLPPSHAGSCPLRGSRSPYTPTTDQTNAAIFISAEGNHCKGSDPAENRALIAVPLKPNVIATDKPQPKEHREQTCTMGLQCTAEHEGTTAMDIKCCVYPCYI